MMQQMCKRIFLISCVLFVAVLQSGCIGLATVVPAECKNETPFTGIHDIFWKQPQPNKELAFGIVIPEVPTPKASTKAEFLKDWGNPDEIITASENGETWIYNKTLWCGLVPVLIVPVPLLLPVCNGFDRIEFQGQNAKRLHTRRIVIHGAVMSIFLVGAGGMDPVCRLPLPPNNGVDSDAAKPASQVSP